MQPLDGLLEEWLPKNDDPLVDPRMRLQTMIDERRGEWGLIEDDCTLLKGFANGIGRSDVDGEIRLCGEYRREVDERLWQAREDLRVKGRMYVTMGICGGLLAAILMW